RAGQPHLRGRDVAPRRGAGRCGAAVAARARGAPARRARAGRAGHARSRQRDGRAEAATREAAGVMAVAFDALTVAAAIEQPVAVVERMCAGLAERGQLVCTTGTTAWPDGALGGTYEFLHALYQHVLYQ